MKTAAEIYEEVSGRKKYLHLYGLLDKEACITAMKEYGKEIVKECISVPSEMYQKQLMENLP